jgi:hypothetical protein
MNRRSMLKFLSFLPFVPLIGRKADAVALPNMEDDLDYWLRKVERCESVGDHKKAEFYRKRLLLAQDAALIRDIQRARNGREFSLHKERVGSETYYVTIPSDLSPQEAMEYLDSIKKHFRTVGCCNVYLFA